MIENITFTASVTFTYIYIYIYIYIYKMKKYIRCSIKKNYHSFVNVQPAVKLNQGFFIWVLIGVEFITSFLSTIQKLHNEQAKETETQQAIEFMTT